ncbi:hypothetical protein [Marinifilum flexuosum]|uniref:Uncharacterized protein n=1 Tax=Marinifilum flexuosum TaxID=1117708 RepID=A0A419X9N6_9BACT|nr:hypothetical protein [Marinifilum flexuosum]RKE04451.1 hypothetical protein BXY64_1471 [Marinifilum flexuosum]
MLGVLPQAAATKLVVAEGAKKYKNLDPAQKQMVNIGGLLVMGLALYAGYKMFSRMNGMIDWFTGAKSEKERKEAENKIQNQINDEISKVGVKPTIGTATAKSIAQSLLDAFEYMGTYEEQVYSNLRVLKNSADWLLVGREYGMPRKRTLVAELYNELDNKEMAIARSILSKIGVTI